MSPKKLKAILYYIVRAFENGELRECEAKYLSDHPRVARKWILKDLWIKI